MESFGQIPGAFGFADGLAIAVGQQLALVQDQHPVVSANFFDQVGGPEYGQAVFFAQGTHVLVERFSACNVQTHRGFVE